MINFFTSPDQYKHWQINIDGDVATLFLNVEETENSTLGYTLKLNSYDLGVDIELNDAVQRIRFEHPEVGAVIITSAKERVFSAGANIQMLGQLSHIEKVNFCKYTNETRISIEDASLNSGQTYLCAINGPASGGGYELALATEHIILVDDGATAISLPEVPSLAVLPGTGGLTRIIDKRHVRRDRADFFCTTSEGVRGKRALDWNLVDELATRSELIPQTLSKAKKLAKKNNRNTVSNGIELEPINRKIEKNQISYDLIKILINRDLRLATFKIKGPGKTLNPSIKHIYSMGCKFWPLAFARELDDAILHLRFNEPEIGTWAFTSEGSPDAMQAIDKIMLQNSKDWFIREIILYLKRTFKRLDISSRSLIALIEPNSCFTGTLAELVLAADTSYMLDEAIEKNTEKKTTFCLTGINFGYLEMSNGLSRISSRFLGKKGLLEKIKIIEGKQLEAKKTEELGLVTFAPDDIDWEDEIRIAFEARASFSPDALSAMEANLRFGGPETMESKIFSRLSVWQNWLFQRPNASVSLESYGTGKQPTFDRNRV
jgi:benzoyl-CoA-dihydrodiol lyase|tara:strand:+ start:990 stop:2630 length:1641 start_codon:yes stop_codon:yes gene_type:complete